MTDIAVLGLGIMGSGIAGNLLRAGYPLSVYNRTKAKAEALLAQGARWAESPGEATASADVIISVLGDDEASRHVWAGQGGALGGLRPGAVAVECSTLSVGWVRELRSLVEARGADFVDAPLAGSKPAAQAGTLTLFIGAQPDVLDRLRPAFASFANNLIHFGPPGSGATYKLINNMMGAVAIATLGEGIALAERAGLNMETVLNAVSVGAVSSPIVKGKVAQVISRDHGDTNFALRWMHKDATYALRLADELGVPVPTVALARELYRMAMARGLSELDFAAVTELVRPHPPAPSPIRKPTE